MKRLSERMLHRSVTCLFLTAVVWMASPAPAQEPVALRLPHDDAETSPVTVQFDGWVRSGGVEVPLPGGDLTRLRPAQARVVGYYDALISGSRAPILAYWAPSERDEVGEKMTESNLETVRRFHAQVEKLTFFADIEYGPYVLVIVDVTRDGRSLPRSYALKRSGELLYLTNELSSDGLYSMWIPALAKGLAEGSVEVVGNREAGR